MGARRHERVLRLKRVRVLLATPPVADAIRFRARHLAIAIAPVVSVLSPFAIQSVNTALPVDRSPGSLNDHWETTA